MSRHQRLLASAPLKSEHQDMFRPHGSNVALRGEVCCERGSHLAAAKYDPPLFSRMPSIGVYVYRERRVSES